MLLCLVLALAGLRLHRSARSDAFIFLLDRSDSIDAATAREAWQTVRDLADGKRGAAGLIAFARQPVLVAPLTPRMRVPDDLPRPADGSATDGAAAIAFASALFPPEASRHLILLSDGNFSGPDTLQAARLAGERGIALDVWPLTNPPAPEVLIARIEAPARVREREPFDLTAHLLSSGPAEVTARLSLNGFRVAERTLEVAAGRSAVTFPNLTLSEPVTAAEVEILSAADTRAENNRASVTLIGQGKPRVLIVDREPRNIAPLAAALEAQGFDAQVRPASGLPRTLEDLQQFDVFLLSDVSALEMSQGEMELYRTWVQDFGGGFAMTGGENSFGVGGYYGTAIERLLPVRMEHDDRIETPTVALLIVLDRSGSMSAPVGETTKMALASQGAVFALEALQSRDSFGVLAVDTVVHIVQPLGPLADPAAARTRILSLTAGGGGIYVYTSLVESFRQLRATDARIKHVILFSDARDAEEKNAGEHSDGAPAGGGSSLDVVAGMLAGRITTSVVALGDAADQDVDFLKQVALRGAGRFYLTDDARALPRIFSTETMKVAQSSLLEEPFLPIVAQPGPPITGIDWSQAPLLLGYNATKAKPTADVLLATERGDPLLATWRAGLGRVAAFTSDAQNRWAGEWLGWPGYGRFWAQLCRSLQSGEGRSPLQINTRPRDGGLDVTIDAVTPDGQFLDDRELTVSLRAAEGATRQQAARQTAPGRYEARFDGLPAASATLAVGRADSDLPPAVLGLHAPLAPEYLTLGPDLPALAAIAAAGKGRILSADDRTFSQPPVSSGARQPLQPWLLGAALLLLPLDIWLRRRNWS